MLFMVPIVFSFVVLVAILKHFWSRILNQRVFLCPASNTMSCLDAFILLPSGGDPSGDPLFSPISSPTLFNIFSTSQEINDLERARERKFYTHQNRCSEFRFFSDFFFSKQPKDSPLSIINYVNFLLLPWHLRARRADSLGLCAENLKLCRIALLFRTGTVRR